MDSSLLDSSVHRIFHRQEYWSGLPFPSPRDLPNPRIKPASPVSPALQADSLPRVTIIFLYKRLNFDAFCYLVCKAFTREIYAIHFHSNGK